jgi:hypothetical protein
MAIEDVTDPGLINVEDQAYPAVLGVNFTPLPANFGELLSASLFAPNPALGVPSTLVPTPSSVQVANQPPPFIPFGGVPEPEAIEVDVAQQSPPGVDVDEFVVTELDQNIQTNETPESIVDFTVTSAVDAETFGPVTSTTKLVRTTVTPALSPFGVTFLLKEGNFFRPALTVTGATNPGPPIIITTSTPHGLFTGDIVGVSGVLGNTAANGQWVVTVFTTTTFGLNGSLGNGAYAGGGQVDLLNSFPRTFVYYNPHDILVTQVMEDGVNFTPLVGDIVTINVARVGFEVVARNAGAFIDTNISTETQPEDPVGVNAPLIGFQGNIQASTGVENPFIGAGVQLPPFIGTFQIANQSLVIGLPENVNVS